MNAIIVYALIEVTITTTSFGQIMKLSEVDNNEIYSTYRECKERKLVMQKKYEARLECIPMKKRI